MVFKSFGLFFFLPDLGIDQGVKLLVLDLIVEAMVVNGGEGDIS